jgi:urea transport system substrate-binding protein
MPDNSRLLELLVEWEQHEEAHDGVRLEDLCRNQPDLLEPLRQRVRVLRAMRGVLNTVAYEETPDGGAVSSVTSPPGYQIVQLVGRGGMGVVYKAWQEALERTVALKMILSGEHADERALARFQTEARAVARLQHPNIVQVFEIGRHQGRPFIALEFLAGGNLEEVLEDFTLTPLEAARLMELLARAVHHAHLHGVVHRDLKPGNVLFTSAGPGPDGRPRLAEPKIVDFGLARQLDRGKRLTASGSVMGTPSYMAPEQASGKTELLGPAVDIFSLGVMLYEMLTRRLPFDGKTEWETIQAVIGGEATPPCQANPHCPPDLEAICLRCLRKDPAERYASAEQLADDLQRFQAGEKPAALPAVGGPYRPSSRWVQLVNGAMIVILAVWAYFLPWLGPSSIPLKLGLLVPQRGDMWENGQGVIDAVNLAIEEANASAGVRERRVKAILGADLTDKTAAAIATQLITKDQVCSLLGCWTSAGRKEVLPVLAQHQQLLIYPAEYEGLEASPNVLYIGTVPNQIVLPAVDWFCREQQCRRIMQVGNDELLDRAVNEVVRDHLARRWPDAAFLPAVYIESEDGVPEAIVKLEAARPDLIVNTISGNLNATFVKKLRSPSSTLRTVPVLAIDCTEVDLRRLDTVYLPGIYVAGSFFATLDTDAARNFEKRLHKKYGATRASFDAMAAAYVGTHLWAQAARTVGPDPLAIRREILGQHYAAPEGLIRFDAASGHAFRYGRLACFDAAGNLQVVHTSPEPIAPQPFPDTRSRALWDSFLSDLQRGWQGRWYR